MPLAGHGSRSMSAHPPKRTLGESAFRQPQRGRARQDGPARMALVEDCRWLALWCGPVTARQFFEHIRFVAIEPLVEVASVGVEAGI
jgi:hypothetical protein